jgi:hypothetical protein
MRVNHSLALAIPFMDLGIAPELADGATVACPTFAAIRATLIRIKAVEREIGRLIEVIEEMVNGKGTFAIRPTDDLV